jgi:hypothetical protein
MNSFLLTSNYISISHGDFSISASGESAEKIALAVAAILLLITAAVLVQQLT